MATLLNELSKEEERLNLIIAKVISMIVLGLCSFFVGLVPIKLTKLIKINTAEEKNLTISLLLCFGGGVLLFTTFVHLQPEVRESFTLLEQENKIPTVGSGLPTSELVFCMGFFFVYLIEELVHMILDRKLQNNAIHRSLSVRCPNNKELSIPRVNLSKSENSNISCISVSNKELLNSQSSMESANEKSEHHHHHHHFHHYGDDSIKKTFRGLLAVLALSFHAIFEGLAVGLENNRQRVWYLFAAIATHKLVIAFCVGVELVSSKTKTLFVFIYIGTFAIVTPLGAFVLFTLKNSKKCLKFVL